MGRPEQGLCGLGRDAHAFAGVFDLVGDALNLLDETVTPAVRRNATKAEVDAFIGGYIVRLTKNAERLRAIRDLPEPTDISLTPE